MRSFGYGTFEPTLSDFWWASSIINTRSCYIDIAPSIQVGNQHSVLIVCSLQMFSLFFHLPQDHNTLVPFADFLNHANVDVRWPPRAIHAGPAAAAYDRVHGLSL